MTVKFICESRQVSEYFWQYSVRPTFVNKNVLQELNQIVSKSPLWFKDELIQFRWTMVSVQGHCDLVNNIFGQN